MKERVLKIILLFVVVVFTSCQSEITNESADPNDDSKKNGDFIWWVNEDGVGEWIEKDESGNWEPKDGVLTDFWGNGNVKMICPFIDGEPFGDIEFWTPEAILIARMEVDNPDYISKFDIFYENGDCFFSTDLENKDSIRLSYFNDEGSLVSQFIISTINNKEQTEGFVMFESSSAKVQKINDTIRVSDLRGELLSFYDVDNLISLFIHPSFYSEFLQKFDNFKDDLAFFNFRIGCLEGDCENGVGSFVLPSQNVYNGVFENGNFNGLGTVFNYKGDTLQYGYYVGGFLNGNGVLFLGNGNKKFMGEFKNGLLNGNGVYEELGNFKYVGRFIDCKYDGEGMVYSINGDSIRINHVNYLRNGPAVYYSNGDSIKQFYENDELIWEEEF